MILMESANFKIYKLFKFKGASRHRPANNIGPESWRYNLRLCWQTPVGQILVRDGEPPKLGFKGPISLATAAGTFLETLIQ
jgi:hypothetical protein